MFKKLKAKLKIRLRKYLGIVDLEETFMTYKNFNDKTVFYHRHKIEEFHGSIRSNREGIDALHDTIESVVHIGTDVQRFPNGGHSWAVVCIEGKINLVKFVDLERRNARDVLQFLKQFEAGRHCIDSPEQGFFYNGLFKF